MTTARSSREHYRAFRERYKKRRLDDSEDSHAGMPPAARPQVAGGKRREYMRDYLRWLWPHRLAVSFLFALALVAAGLQMIEPLFMRFIS
jgi:ATP-binding cassette subfamily B protein/subfamily B ATP-binding cassette protein MsbA